MAVTTSVRADPEQSRRIEARSKQRHRSPFDKLRVTVLYVFVVLSILHLSPAHASVQQEIYVTGHVQSFGGYVFTEAVSFDITHPGEQEIGRIVVDGLYNGEYPWIMRAYTDNLHYTGVAGAIRRPKPAGLISNDGRFVIPLQINSPSFGENAWRRVPDINESDYASYRPGTEPGKDDYSDCILMGIDPRNASWVAGPDGILYTDDDNLLGDLTAKTPCEFTLQADLEATDPEGSYQAYLYIELIPAP